MSDDKILRFVAEFMDGMSHEGDYGPAIEAQMQRALRKAKLDPKLLSRAKEWLNRQDRI